MSWVNFANLRDTKEAALLTGSSELADEIVTKEEYDVVVTKLKWAEGSAKGSLAIGEDLKSRLDAMTVAHANAEIKLMASVVSFAEYKERLAPKIKLNMAIKSGLLVYAILVTAAVFMCWHGSH